MDLLQHKADAQTLSPQTDTASKIKPEALLQFYRALPDKKRATYFSDTGSVAQQCAVHQRTVQRWIDNGWILAVRIGKKYEVYLPSLDGYLNRCQWRRME